MKYPKKIKMTPRQKRAGRVRKKVFGTMERPRLSVFRSLSNIYVQLIDDVKGITLLGFSSIETEIKKMEIKGTKIDVSKTVGKLLAEKAKKKGIKKVVFDRSQYHYHGRVKAVAEGAREGGLEF